LKAVYEGLRAVATSLRCLRIVASYLRVIYEKNIPWTIIRQFLTCPKMTSPLTDQYGFLQVMTSYLRIPASYIRMLAIDYDLAIRMTRKKNQCMLSGYKG